MKLKRNLTLPLLIFCLSQFGLTGQQVFDIYSFNVPAGYNVEKVEKSIILSSTDGKLSILMLPVQQCDDIAYTEFGKDWTEFVASRYSVLGFPNRITSVFRSEWEMTTGQAKVFNDQVTMWIQLRNFTKQNKKATVIFFAVDDKQQETIKAFISDLRLSDTPVTSSIPSQFTTDQISAINSEDLKSVNNNAEIWMSIKMGAWNMSGDNYSGNYYDLSKNKMTYKVLFPDGTYTGNEIPSKGLAGFTKTSKDASGYTWGTYVRSGNKLAFKSDYEDMVLLYKSEYVLENPSSVFLYYKCKKVDGLKLNGSWSYIPYSENDPYYDESGCRQVIYFNDDMTFNDRGVFVSDCRYPDRSPEDAPGTGTYEIKDYTLILRYSDGRIIRKSFTGALMNDPFLDNEIIYIGGNNFFKRKNKKELFGTANNTTPDIQATAIKPYSRYYDNFIYKIPAGWKSSESQQFLELFPEQTKEKEVFSILLLKGKTSSASLSEELASVWDEFAVMMRAEKYREVSGGNYNEGEISRTAAGWEYITGHGSIKTSDNYFVHAYVIRVKDRVERIIVLAREIWLDGVRNNIDPTIHHYPHYTTITDFIFNLGFVNMPAKELPEPSFRGPGVLGVWAGIGFMGGQLESTYIIFFDNGQVYYGSRFPINGLYNLDTYADKERVPRYWGNYVIMDGKGTVKMPYGTFPFRIEDEKLVLKPISEEHKYIRIPDVDNVKLNGKWMITGENDLPYTITFNPDGTFLDKGALRVLDHSLYQYYSIADGGGTGKYYVKDRTIIFNYNDGREIKIAFPGREFTPGNQSPEKLILSFNEDILVKQ